MGQGNSTTIKQPKRSRRGNVLAWIAMLSAVVPLSWLMFIQEDSEYLLGLWRRGRIEAFIGGWGSADYTIHDAPGTGDVAMEFTNLKNTPPAARFASVAYIKSAYELYPRRVVSMWEQTLPGISGNPYLTFHPSMQWLQAHRVDVLFSYTMDADRTWKIETIAVPPSAYANTTKPVTQERR